MAVLTQPRCPRELPADRGDSYVVGLSIGCNKKYGGPPISVMLKTETRVSVFLLKYTNEQEPSTL